jgi:hypothetical protein
VNLLSFCVLCEVKTKNAGFKRAFLLEVKGNLLWQIKFLAFSKLLNKQHKSCFGYQSLWKTFGRHVNCRLNIN